MMFSVNPYYADFMVNCKLVVFTNISNCNTHHKKCKLQKHSTGVLRIETSLARGIDR